METRRWVNPTQPQTMQIAVFLLYINAVFYGLGFLRSQAVLYLALVAGGVAAGYGIANERKWGYGLGLAMALFPFVIRAVVLGIGDVLSADPISLLFEVALVALLLHPQSRDYQRIWFK